VSEVFQILNKLGASCHRNRPDNSTGAASPQTRGAAQATMGKGNYTGAEPQIESDAGCPSPGE
jgi:hypothetical protein